MIYGTLLQELQIYKDHDTFKKTETNLECVYLKKHNSFHFKSCGGEGLAGPPPMVSPFPTPLIRPETSLFPHD